MNTLQIYVTCGEWRVFDNKTWTFIVDGEKRGRILNFDATTTFDELKLIVSEDYEVEQSTFDVEITYLPTNLSDDCPPVVISNDRQLRNFVMYFKNNDLIRLYVMFKARVQEERSDEYMNLNEESCDLEDECDAGFVAGKTLPPLPSINYCLQNSSDSTLLVTKGQFFKSKEFLQAHMEISAMKFKFDYRVTKSDTKIWSIRCVENSCQWRVRAQGLGGSSYFRINKYVSEHTCAPSKKNKFCRSPSTRTIGHLIMPKYEGVKEGPKPSDIINFIRTEYGFELTYSQAWESREYAVNEVRGIPEKSYSKIPKYLHMLQEANPGTYTNYAVDVDDTFLYLFVSFGQSLRGFHKAVRRVIVVDGTFLKNKYKGVLLVARALDGNNNLYPIAFGIADTENDNSWDWFLSQLKVVIADSKGLAFVSDRHSSILKAVANIYPLATHGICIHHLISNVIVHHKGKGVAGLVAKASKAYRTAQFDNYFTDICNISPAIGRYLEDADVKKWARCHFLGYRYDINTNNPAESINSSLRSPREYPVIPLLDSIREMLTRWFYERRDISARHGYPLTAKIEKKVSRRIGKAATMKTYPISNHIFQIRGDTSDFVVDLEKRTCSCGKFETVRLPCCHAIKAIFAIGKDTHHFTQDVFTTTAWRTLFEENINPIGIPEAEWSVPHEIACAIVFPPESRRGLGRRKKNRHESVEDRLKNLGEGLRRESVVGVVKKDTTDQHVICRYD